MLNEIYELQLKNASLKDMVDLIYNANSTYIKEVSKAIDINEYGSYIRNFCIVNRSFCLNLNYIDKDEMNEDVYCHRISVDIGSLLEGVLQFFLLTFEDDYNNVNWKKWVGCDINELNKLFSQFLNSLVKNNTINGKQKSSLKDDINRELKIRANGKKIETVMLDELIGLYRTEDILLLDEKYQYEETEKEETQFDLYDLMDSIKKGRNTIHIFTKCSKLNKEELLELIKYYYLIVSDLTYRVICLNEDDYCAKNGYQKNLGKC